jgi:excisionase family DNA binding protein
MKQFFSTREAAEYLGLSFHTMKYHVHRAKTIEPVKLGNSLVFTRGQLDEFKATRRSPGRPKKTKN